MLQTQQFKVLPIINKNMIWKTIENLIAFYVLFKAIKSYKSLQNLILKLKQTPIKNVRQIKELLQLKKPFQKIFVVIKGIAQSNSKYGQKDIVSIVQSTPLRTKQPMLNISQKINWQNIIEKYDWRRPRNFSNIKFSLKDIIQNQTLQVSNCSKTDISSALSQIYSDVIIYQQTKNPFIKIIKSFYNFLIKFPPFKLFMKKTKIGHELKYFGILQGQYLLSIGQIFKTSQGKIKMQNPFYLTKQKGFIQKRLKRKMNYLYWLILAIGLLEIYFLYGLLNRFIKFYRQRKQLKRYEQQEEDRSQNQGDFANCIICYTRVRSIALKPCRHYAFCEDCYRNFKDKKCPVCKADIDGILKIVKRKK